MIHSSTIENYAGSVEELAEELGNLKYDALAHFLGLLATKLEQDGQKDKERKRIKLATNLFQAAANLKESQLAIEDAWQICAPYTK